MSDYHAPGDREVSGWALGGVTFAACVLTIVGVFQVIAGLAAIIDDEFFVVARNYTYDVDTSGWGWIHLLLGVLLVITGFGLFGRAAWAGMRRTPARLRKASWLRNGAWFRRCRMACA